MSLLIILILVIILLGGGGSYYAYNAYGGPGLGSGLGLVVVVLSLYGCYKGISSCFGSGRFSPRRFLIRICSANLARCSSERLLGFPFRAALRRALCSAVRGFLLRLRATDSLAMCSADCFPRGGSFFPLRLADCLARVSIEAFFPFFAALMAALCSFLRVLSFLPFLSADILARTSSEALVPSELPAIG
jgi:hypothetical protein